MFYFVKLGGCHMHRNENLFFAPHGIVFYFWILWTMQHLQKYIERTNLCKKKKCQDLNLSPPNTKYFEYVVTKHITYSRVLGFWRNMISWTNVHNNLACIKCTNFYLFFECSVTHGWCSSSSTRTCRSCWLCLLFWPCLPRQGYCV